MLELDQHVLRFYSLHQDLINRWGWWVYVLSNQQCGNGMFRNRHVELTVEYCSTIEGR